MIKVGEYARFENGEIHKVIGVEKGSVKIKSDYREWIGICCIVKHSEHLIDLIEAGDYVNGMEVLDIHKPRDLWEPIEIRVDSRYTNFILTEDIKTILTKEIYMANCYKVGGEDE